MEQERKKRKMDNVSIRNSIFLYFTITALIAVLLIGVAIYTRLSAGLEETIKGENVSIVNQINSSMEVYLRNMMKLSDSIYYGVIKNEDLTEQSVTSKLNLLYTNNKDQVLNIAVLNKKGELIVAVPAARLTERKDITKEDWFVQALNKPENLHFTVPHVQNNFELSDNSYKWVITMSRAVEITKGRSTEQAVLFIDMAHQGLGEVLNDTYLGSGGYLYLMNARGELIWHPKDSLIASGRVKENNLVAAEYSDGSHEETFEGEKRNITVKTVGYTGWKLIGVTKNTGIYIDSVKMKIFVFFVICLILFVVALTNSYISRKITDPISELEKSVKALEEGNLDAEIYVGGSYEVQHLGKSVKEMSLQIKNLMADIVKEHESKRKSEFDSLQSQINPHFLYNTLDIIVWMIENEKREEAAKIVTALARFFRVSLSNGKNIIPVKSEIDHVRNYLMIQHMRFKNKFSYSIEVSDEVLNLASIKLMLQPMVENAIYHGMEFMDGDGEIEIKVWREEDILYFTVKDNGLGMTKERMLEVMTGESHVPSSKGSGIGVKNVNERIKLYFGEEYGLSIVSEPDEGTLITLRLPARSYEEVVEFG